MQKKELGQGIVYTVLLMCIGLIAACVLTGLSLVYGFAVSILGSMLILGKYHYSLTELLKMMWIGIRECRLLYILILLIGVTVSVWIASGVVPSMIYYGFEYLKDMNFVLTAFLLITICSVFMGTAVGTVSTIGIAILGIGKGFGVPMPILLGAVVSGAFVADKISPISGLINLTLSSVKVDYKSAIRSMLKTLIPTIALSALIYYWLGVKYSSGMDIVKISELQTNIKLGFFISPWLLLMPLLIVVMSSFGVKILYAIISGLSGGAFISLLMQKMPLNELFHAIMFGYRAATPSEQLNELLVSGGVVSMLEVLLIIMGAIALSSLLEGSGMINQVTRRMVSSVKNKGDLVINTGLVSSALTTVTCDQTMGIVLPGRLFRDKYDDLDVDRSILARTISDTGTIIAPLMPWNVNALIISLIVGTTVAYQPYAVLCYIAPLITFGYGVIQRYKNNKVEV